MAKYKLIENGILIPSKNMAIPAVTGNGDWDEYQDWIAQGNTPDPADVPNPMDAIRAERDRLLAIADIEINKMEDGGVTATALRLHRNALRDIPKNFPNADMSTFDWSAL